jgi:hypothetical protein
MLGCVAAAVQGQCVRKVYKWLEANKQAIVGREDRAGISEGGADT